MPEKILWSTLRGRKIENVKFRRQYPIGPYTLDFFCEELRLCVEVDGAHHALQAEHDRARTVFLNERGIHVVRYAAKVVSENTQGVVDAIREEIEKLKREYHEPSPRPSPNGRGGKRSQIE